MPRIDSAYLSWWLLEVSIKLGSWIKCEENWSTFKRSLFHLLVMMIGNGLSLRSPNDETKIDCWQNNRTCSLRTSEFVQKWETDSLISCFVLVPVQQWFIFSPRTFVMSDPFRPFPYLRSVNKRKHPYWSLSWSSLGERYFFKITSIITSFSSNLMMEKRIWEPYHLLTGPKKRWKSSLVVVKSEQV